jgi:hypothetical protein
MQGARDLKPPSALRHFDARPNFLEIVLKNKNRAVTESAFTVAPANQTTR